MKGEEGEERMEINEEDEKSGESMKMITEEDRRKGKRKGRSGPEARKGAGLRRGWMDGSWTEQRTTTVCLFY